MLACRSLRVVQFSGGLQGRSSGTVLKIGPSLATVERVASKTPSKRYIATNGNLRYGKGAYVDSNRGSFHNRKPEDEDEEDMEVLDVDDHEERNMAKNWNPGSANVRQFLQFGPKGQVWEYKGTETETGTHVYRAKGLAEDAPVRRYTRLVSAGTKSSGRSFRSVIFETSVLDKHMEEFEAASKPSSAAPLDFSKLSSQSSDVKALVKAVSAAIDSKINPHNESALIQSFETAVQTQTNLRPLEVSCFAIGRELLELHIINALSSTYPHLPHEGIVKLTQNAGSPEALSRALLDLKLESFVQLVPATPFSKFEDPSSVCLTVASNAYTSLIGWLYNEKGFEFASQFIFRTLPMQRVTQETLKQLNLIDGIKNSKTELKKLLERLRFPLPTYEIEEVVLDKKEVTQSGYGNRFVAIAKSGHQIIGRGQGNTKVRAEARAAANALLLHWSKEESL